MPPLHRAETTAPTTAPTTVPADTDARPPDPLLRAVLAGLASGSRSTYGLAAVALSSDPPRAATPVPEHALGSRGGRLGTALAVLGETTGDLLPAAPSRLTPSGLVPRLLTGAASGALLARRAGAAAAGPAAVGAAAALVGALAGHRWRASTGARHGGDVLGALCEDAVAAVLAVAAVRDGRPHRP